MPDGAVLKFESCQDDQEMFVSVHGRSFLSQKRDHQPYPRPKQLRAVPVRRAILAEAFVVVWLGMAAPADVAVVGTALWQDWIVLRPIARHRAVIRSRWPGLDGVRVAV